MVTQIDVMKLILTMVMIRTLRYKDKDLLEEKHNNKPGKSNNDDKTKMKEIFAKYDSRERHERNVLPPEFCCDADSQPNVVARHPGKLDTN